MSTQQIAQATGHDRSTASDGERTTVLSDSRPTHSDRMRASSGKRARRHPRRRGVAMLLVLVCLFTATVIASSYLASRDNSAAIGNNVSAAVTARWSASSSLEVAVAIMETKTDWRTLHADGKLLDDYVIGDAVTDLDIIDLETGEPPNEESTYMLLTATAVVDGVEQVAEAVAYVEPWYDGSVDVDLSEFAIFAGSRIGLEDEATVTRWPNAPLSELGGRIAFGTQATGAGDVAILGNAAAIDTTIFTAPDASSLLVNLQSGPLVETVTLPDVVPLVAPPDPGVEPPDEYSPYPYIDVSSEVITVSDDVRVDTAIHKNGTEVTVEDGVTITVDNDIVFESDSTLIIEGEVTLVIFDDLKLDHASIQINDDSELTIFVRGDVDIHDGYIGDGPYDSDTDRDSSGNAEWMDPERIIVYSIPSVEETDWVLEHNSVVKGSLYAPHPDSIEIRDDSAVYGRITGREIDVKNRGAIFYDPALDSGMGYTSPDSDLFTDDGNLLEVLAALMSLDPANLIALAEAGDLLVYAGDTIYGDVPIIDPGNGGTFEPTERTVTVDYEVIAFGAAMEDWEDAAERNLGDTIVNTDDDQ
ncbi:MAG: hypothetical protein JSV91_01535 [Phycisphaerales bacterium]|nr:MAG: hypothetical protein JSV91_01535 [Phycisphaerales bacterium]